jgi:hypothetical protein
MLVSMFLRHYQDIVVINSTSDLFFKVGLDRFEIGSFFMLYSFESILTGHS